MITEVDDWFPTTRADRLQHTPSPTPAIQDQWIHFERVQRAGSMEEIAVVTARFADSMGFEHHGYACRALSPDAAGASDFHAFHNDRDEWGSTYDGLQRGSAADQDARVQHARSGLPPASWNTHGQFSHARPMDALLRRARRQVQMAANST